MDERTVGNLKQFGLTDYEIRAYLTLVRFKSATADQISQSGGIPLPRVYDTLVELQRKGFVLISNERPKRFKAVSVDKALSGLIGNRRKEREKEFLKLEQSVMDIQDSVSKIEPIDIEEKRCGIWYSENKKSIIENMQEVEDKAKNEILIFSGDFSWLADVKANIRNAIKRGVIVRALIRSPEDSPEVSKNIELAKKLGIKVKSGYSGTMRGQIADSEIAYIASRKDGNESKSLDNSYELIVFSTQPLISAIRENFEFWWERL
jgi:sugar-specific transcriptional regulator TrmB